VDRNGFYFNDTYCLIESQLFYSINFYPKEFPFYFPFILYKMEESSLFILYQPPIK